MRINISEKPSHLSINQLAVEMVECKGRGHPDSVCDSLADEVGRQLCDIYKEKFGSISHYNVDKVLLRGGVAQPKFGGGAVVEPIEIYIAGRATTQSGEIQIPIEELVYESCDRWLKDNFHALDVSNHVRIHSLIRPGSTDLTELYARYKDGGIPLANDTSFGVGFAPLSHLEETVKSLAELMGDRDFISDSPEIGEDIKVMGVRTRDEFRFTVSCAFIGKYVNNMNDYVDKRHRLTTQLGTHLRESKDINSIIHLNTADQVENDSIFLTVTGTSAEAGDDGQVGRGNRANGLITPYRPMSLEAVSGKNPVSHVGRLYNIWSNDIANDLLDKHKELASVECFLVSQIGRPINEPQTVDLSISLSKGAEFSPALQNQIEAEIQTYLSTFTKRACEGVAE